MLILTSLVIETNSLDVWHFSLESVWHLALGCKLRRRNFA